MLGANKILTVSYGTFSCTLEGFDDPFSTMRSIAEYFRDLAADDRYFGAEPPTPDPEMLHRIAQREVKKRVEARVGDNGILLRQSDEDANSDFGTETASAAGLSHAATAAAAGAALTPMGESVADKLARIREAVARAESRAGDGFSEDEHADAFARAPEAEPYSGPEETIAAYAGTDDFGTDDEDADETVEAPGESAEEIAEEIAAESAGMTEAQDEALVDIEAALAEELAATPDPAAAYAAAEEELAEELAGDEAASDDYIPLPDAEPVAEAQETEAESTTDAYFEAPFYAAETEEAPEAAWETGETAEDSAEDEIAEAEDGWDVEAAAIVSDEDWTAEAEEAEAAEAAAEEAPFLLTPDTEVVAEEAAEDESAETPLILGEALASEAGAAIAEEETAEAAETADDPLAGLAAAIATGEKAEEVEVASFEIEAEVEIEAENAEAEDVAEPDMTAAEDTSPRARLVKMRRSDYERAAEGEDVDDVLAQIAAATSAADTPSSLSEEDEAALAAELAAAEEEFAEDEADTVEAEAEMAEDAYEEAEAEEAMEAAVEAEDMADLEALDGAAPGADAQDDEFEASLRAALATDADEAETAESPLELGADALAEEVADAAWEDATPDLAEAEAARWDDGIEDAEIIEPETAEDEEEAFDLFATEEEAELVEDANETVGDNTLVDEDEADDMATAHPLADKRPGDDAAFDRILEETNSRLDTDDASRRRSAIAHLKAAVAATKADAEAGPLGLGRDKSSEMDRYREDLAKVVRPRRPMPRTSRAERGTPLVLVSEQRIDNDARGSEDGPREIRPRRISRDLNAGQPRRTPAADNIFLEAESFADFAAEMGATDLPELLEAAAAYVCFVEGQPSFSRPALMRQLAEIDTGGLYSREEGLRSFGILLREGKIERLTRGEYTVSKRTRFNPERREAG